MKHLFIGGGGLVGSAAVQIARNMSLDFQATSRKSLNLENLDLDKLPPADVVYLIAAMRNPTDCDEFPKKSWVINADAPTAIARHYDQRLSFVVFVSSDAVMKSHGHYASQKFYVEQFIMTIGGAIVRPGRIPPEKAPEVADLVIKAGLRKEACTYNWSATSDQP